MARTAKCNPNSSATKAKPNGKIAKAKPAAEKKKQGGAGASKPRGPQLRDAAPIAPRPCNTDLPRPITMVIYNAKGGVMKTTHCWSLAWTMARSRQMRVLVVDLDSQADLARTLMRQKIIAWAAATGQEASVAAYYSRADTPEELQAYRAAVNEPAAPRVVRSVRDALRPLMGGNTAILKVMPDEVIARTAENSGSLHVLHGSTDMSDIDSRMAMAEGNMDDNSKRPWQAAVWAVIEQAAASVHADVVLLDMNPNLGVMNRNLITSSDYIIIATRPEDFSCENIDTFMNKMTRNSTNNDALSGSWLQHIATALLSVALAVTDTASTAHVRPKVNADGDGYYTASFKLPQGDLTATPAHYHVPKVLGYVLADFFTTEKAKDGASQGVLHDRAAVDLESEMTRIHSKVQGIMQSFTDFQVTRPPTAENPDVPGAPKLVHLAMPEQIYSDLNVRCM
eukprot:12343-Heterococcus_DN1.PRE.2